MKLVESLASFGGRLVELGRYMGLGSRRRRRVVDDVDSLAEFIDSRASHVGQSALYGYLKTRAGTRFPQLFEHPEFLVSINIAKWQVWAACVSDLAVFSGGLLRSNGAGEARVGEIVTAVVAKILDKAGTPEEAGGEFSATVEAVRARVAGCDWSALGDNDSPFTESPAALVRWAPVVDELKQYDEEIVRNSVRFRWIEVRQALRRDIDTAAFALPEA